MPRPDIADGGSTPMPGRRSAVTRSGGVETTVHQERRRIYPAYRPSRPRTRPGIRRSGRRGLSFAPGAPSWRNWQTRRSQKPLSERTCGFESHTRHQGRTVFRFPAISGLTRSATARRRPGPAPLRPARQLEVQCAGNAVIEATSGRRPAAQASVVPKAHAVRHLLRQAVHGSARPNRIGSSARRGRGALLFRIVLAEYLRPG